MYAQIKIDYLDDVKRGNQNVRKKNDSKLFKEPYY